MRGQAPISWRGRRSIDDDVELGIERVEEYVVHDLDSPFPKCGFCMVTRVGKQSKVFLRSGREGQGYDGMVFPRLPPTTAEPAKERKGEAV